MLATAACLSGRQREGAGILGMGKGGVAEEDVGGEREGGGGGGGGGYNTRLTRGKCKWAGK